MADYDYVILFLNEEGEWEKAIVSGIKAKDQFLVENADAKPFIKRFLDANPGTGNVSFDSYQEAEESAKISGGRVQPAMPPAHFSQKNKDLQFYLEDP